MEIIEFLLSWIGLYFLIITSMTFDNLFWMSSSPEWFEVKNRKFKDYLHYVFFDRIVPVWTDWRDIIPAIITSFILTISLINVFLGISLLVLAFLLLIPIIKTFKEVEW